MSSYLRNALVWWNERSPEERNTAYASAALTTAALGALYAWHLSRRADEIPCDEGMPFAVIEAHISKCRMRKNMNRQLRALLDQYCTERSSLYIEYNGFMSSHASHVIVALYRLGCTKDTIVTYLKDIYMPRLQTKTEYKKDYYARFGAKPLPLFQNVDISINKYVYFFKGRRENFYGLYKKLKNELETNESYQNNPARLTAKFFPLFSSGIAGATLHALIQLGYGLTAEHKETVLEGLAYLVHSYMQFDTQLQSMEEMQNDTEYTVNTDTNSTSSLHDPRAESTIFDVLHSIQRDQYLPESPVSRLKQYSNSAEIKNMSGAGVYIRSMSILSNHAQAELTQKFFPLLPQLSNLFAFSSRHSSETSSDTLTQGAAAKASKASNISNSNLSNLSNILNAPNVDSDQDVSSAPSGASGASGNLTNTQNDENNKNDESSPQLSRDHGQRIIMRIRKYLLTYALAVWTYCKGPDYNNFYLFHCVTGAWALAETLEKTMLYQSNSHACLNAIRQYHYVLGAIYAMEGCPDLNVPDWLRTAPVRDVVSRRHGRGIYKSAAPKMKANEEVSKQRDKLKRQIATMVTQLKPGGEIDVSKGNYSNTNTFGGRGTGAGASGAGAGGAGASGTSGAGGMDGDGNDLDSYDAYDAVARLYETQGKGSENMVWRDEHVYKGLQLILEHVDDGVVDLRLARDAIAKLRYPFCTSSVIEPLRVKILNRVKRMVGGARME